MKLFLRKGTALVVVAHPDDETIWMGGTILTHPQVRWTIISLCRAEDPDRAPKFRRVCRRLGARGIIFDLEDEGALTIRESVPEIARRIRKICAHARFDFLFTHGYNGEYGHPRHKGVHRAVKRLVRMHELHAKHSFAFSYRLKRDGSRALPKLPAHYVAGLAPKILREKKRIIHALYGFRKTDFEYRSCSKKETFNRLS